MPQNQRTYRCSCGIVEDRDVHAAKNMLWIYENLVGRDAAEFTLEEFEASMHKYFNNAYGQALDNEPRRCSVFS